ncbi:MAG TPA: hypothetical protein VD835_06720 [Pyrinomonadaceae bacterium]|nr:hypothetical protein [Pyrinomonadaceae bacterium]
MNGNRAARIIQMLRRLKVGLLNQLLMKVKTKLFLILWLAGLAGVLSFLLVDLSALLSILLLPSATEIPTMTPALKLLSLIQPLAVLSLAVFVGVALASKIGLSSPVAEAADPASLPLIIVV